MNTNNPQYRTPADVALEIDQTRNRMDSTLDEISHRTTRSELVGGAVEWVRRQFESLEPEHAKTAISDAGRVTAEAVRNHPVAFGLGVASIAAAAWPSRWTVGEEKREELADKARDLRDSAKESANVEAAKMKAMAHLAEEKIESATADAKEKGREVLAIGHEYVDRGRVAATRATSRSRRLLRRQKNENPIALCAGAWVVGLIAGVLAPRTSAEDKAFGAYSEEFRRELAEEGRAALRDARKNIERRQLDPEGLGERAEGAVDQLADKAEDVVSHV